MRPGGGASKGGAYERTLARQLSMWWFGDEGYLWRRPGPGSRFFNQNYRHTGDIVPVADRKFPAEKEWIFHIEAKCWSKNRLKLDSLLWPKKSPIIKIWRKVLEERRSDLIAVLILKANRTDPVCVTSSLTVETLGLSLSSYATMKTPEKSFKFVLPYDLIVFPLSDLLKLKVKNGKGS